MDGGEIVPNDHGIGAATVSELGWCNAENDFGSGLGLLAIKFTNFLGSFSPSWMSRGSVNDLK